MSVFLPFLSKSLFTDIAFIMKGFFFFKSEKDKKNRFGDLSGLCFIFELSNVFSYK